MENDGNSLPQISDKNELVAKLTGTGQRSGSCIFYVHALPFRKKKKEFGFLAVGNPAFT